MRSEDVLSQATTPLAGPAFPHGPYRFTDREYLTVVYRTDADADALRRVVPCSARPPGWPRPTSPYGCGGRSGCSWAIPSIRRIWCRWSSWCPGSTPVPKRSPKPGPSTGRWAKDRGSCTGGAGRHRHRLDRAALGGGRPVPHLPSGRRPGRTAALSGASRPWHGGALARVGRSALRQAPSEVSENRGGSA